jgi:DNA-binding beta-propeller fold protein YncE
LNGTIRKVTRVGTNWVVTTLAGLAGSGVGMAADSAGNIYVADYGNQTIRKITAAGG